MNNKYIIIDFGKVIAYPTSGHWDITLKFKELIDMNTFNMDMFTNIRKKYSYILSKKAITLEDEYNMFKSFYENILHDLNINDYKNISNLIAYDRTYNNNKYTLYNDIYNELEELNKKYKIILLTDNWPSVVSYLKEYNLYNYFYKIYISSYYGVEKNDKRFFYFPINECNINPSETYFIDDYEPNLIVGNNIGFNSLLMDRDNIIKSSKYKIINNLYNI